MTFALITYSVAGLDLKRRRRLSSKTENMKHEIIKFIQRKYQNVKLFERKYQTLKFIQQGRNSLRQEIFFIIIFWVNNCVVIHGLKYSKVRHVRTCNNVSLTSNKSALSLTKAPPLRHGLLPEVRAGADLCLLLAQSALTVRLISGRAHINRTNTDTVLTSNVTRGHRVRSDGDKTDIFSVITWLGPFWPGLCHPTDLTNFQANYSLPKSETQKSGHRHPRGYHKSQDHTLCWVTRVQAKPQAELSPEPSCCEGKYPDNNIGYKARAHHHHARDCRRLPPTCWVEKKECVISSHINSIDYNDVIKSVIINIEQGPMSQHTRAPALANTSGNIKNKIYM